MYVYMRERECVYIYTHICIGEPPAAMFTCKYHEIHVYVSRGRRVCVTRYTCMCHEVDVYVSRDTRVCVTR